METKLEDALNGVETPEEVDTPEVETPEPEVKADGPARDEHGRFAPKSDEKGVEEPAPQEPEPPSEQQLPKEEYTALRAVRDENKELKQQIAALQQQFASQQAKPQVQQQVPDFWDDPNAAFDARIQQFGTQLMQQFQQQQTMQRLEASEAAAKAKYTDYGEAFGHFQQAVQMNPGLIAQMQAATDPGEFAYKTGKRAMDLEQVGSLDDLIAREVAKREAELRAAMPAPRLPETTATDGSVGSRKGPEWSGPTDLNSLLP